jgi:2-dehydro-3-deoxygluconokinase
MSKLKIKNRSECTWDAAGLGEIMLRFDPNEGRIKTARQFTVWEGGGEYNVVRGLKKCFGLNTTVVTGIPENELGYLLQDFIFQGGVDTSHVKWFPYDGMGQLHRQALNFVERGFGIRGALGVSDRAYTAAAALKPGDIDWTALFSEEGARWFHCGGIYAALSDSTQEVILEAMKAAKENGTVTSYDLNFRPSLWKSRGGQKRAIEVNRKIAPYVDVMIGNEEDFIAALGLSVTGMDEKIQTVAPEAYKEMIKKATNEFPNFSVIATTLREVKTATINGWQALLWYDGSIYQSRQWSDLEILDRVGGGDSFASGLIYGFLSGKDPGACVNYGAAHGALAMTTPGDTSMASLAEVEKILEGGSARVDR